jgi:Fe-S-cluster-containing hydrogenase component 2
MNLYKIDKAKCLGCTGCTVYCPKGITVTSKGIAKIKDHEELEKCGGENLCPHWAIVRKDVKKKKDTA